MSDTALTADERMSQVRAWAASHPQHPGIIADDSRECLYRDVVREEDENVEAPA